MPDLAAALDVERPRDVAAVVVDDAHRVRLLDDRPDDGAVALATVNDELGADFESASHATLGGLVFDRLGRPPAVGDTVTADGFRLEVEAVDGARIETVTLRRVADDESPEPG